MNPINPISSSPPVGRNWPSYSAQPGAASSTALGNTDMITTAHHDAATIQAQASHAPSPTTITLHRHVTCIHGHQGLMTFLNFHFPGRTPKDLVDFFFHNTDLNKNSDPSKKRNEKTHLSILLSPNGSMNNTSADKINLYLSNGINTQLQENYFSLPDDLANPTNAAKTLRANLSIELKKIVTQSQMSEILNVSQYLISKYELNLSPIPIKLLKIMQSQDMDAISLGLQEPGQLPEGWTTKVIRSPVANIQQRIYINPHGIQQFEHPNITESASSIHLSDDEGPAQLSELDTIHKIEAMSAALTDVDLTTNNLLKQTISKNTVYMIEDVINFIHGTVRLQEYSTVSDAAQAVQQAIRDEHSELVGIEQITQYLTLRFENQSTVVQEAMSAAQSEQGSQASKSNRFADNQNDQNDPTASPDFQGFDDHGNARFAYVDLDGRLRTVSTPRSPQAWYSSSNLQFRNE